MHLSCGSWTVCAQTDELIAYFDVSDERSHAKVQQTMETLVLESHAHRDADHLLAQISISV